jgi:hypothetical protein
MKSAREKVVDAAILHGLVIVIWAVFNLVRLRSERFRQALDRFQATYQFRAGTRARRLIFSAGRIATRGGPVPSPDYELILLDPWGVLRQLLKNPNDLIRLLMENKIDQHGNNYFLFKFGYLLGLCERWFREAMEKLAPGSKKKWINDPG